MEDPPETGSHAVLGSSEFHIFKWKAEFDVLKEAQTGTVILLLPSLDLESETCLCGATVLK